MTIVLDMPKIPAEGGHFIGDLWCGFHKPLGKEEGLRESPIMCKSPAHVSLLMQKEYAILFISNAIRPVCSVGHVAVGRDGDKALDEDTGNMEI